MWTSPCDGLGRWIGVVASPCCKLPPIPSPLILLHIISRFSYMKHLVFWQLILIFLFFKLIVQAHYPLAWMFFFHTLTTVFSNSYLIKTLCSCWVWKLSNDACLLNLIPTAPFLMQSDWLEKKANQSQHILPSAGLVKQEAYVVS